MAAIGRFWRNLSIGSRLMGLVSLLVILLVLVLTHATVRREQASFRQELEDQARLLLDTLPLTMRDPLYFLELDELVDIATVVSKNEHITLFVIYDRQGAVLVDAAEPVYAQQSDPLGAALLAETGAQLRLDWQEGQLVAGRAIAVGNQQLGAVAIGLSTAPLDQKIAALTRQSLLLALGMMVIGVMLAVLLARQLTHPLGALAHVASQMTGGDLETRVELHSGDEIGQLGAAFNQMADAIQRREIELRELAAGLERTVAARTAELREQNETLIVARKQAEEANRAKSAVLSMVSHELRTPLTSILGFAKLSKRRLAQFPCPETPEETAKVVQLQSNIDIIVSEGERLLDLINNVLDLAKIESGKLHWEMRALAIDGVIRQAVTATTSLFKDDAVALHVAVEPELPCVRGDHDRLVQVMVNLISNAVKFTDMGSITCRVQLQDGALVVSVADTGIGIDSRDYDKLFERFVQVRNPLSDKVQGTGLGLPICKEIVEHHGGRIWVESVLGEGSTFFFTLPVS